MIIVDSRADKIKKIVIIILVMAVIIAAGWLAISFFKKKAEEKKLSSQEAGKEQGGIGENRSISETEAKFDQDRKTCLESFNGLENMSTEEVKSKEKEIVGLDIEKAKYYYFCLSLKNNSVQYCDALKSDEGAYKICQHRFSLYSQFLFPALKTNRCDSEFIDACKNTGENDCESSCRGLILKETEECEKITGSAAIKNACLAISKNDANICNLSNQDDRENCQELFYFLKAAKENNSSHVGKIERVAFRPVAQLYFDSNYQCEKILAGLGENACNKKYTRDYLRELESQAGQQQNNDVK